MAATDNVYAFPTVRRPRPAKAALPPGDRDVRELIFLAPHFHAQRPHKVSEVVRYIRNMMPAPPPFDEGDSAATPALEVRAAGDRRHTAYVLAMARQCIADGHRHAVDGHQRAVAARRTMAVHTRASLALVPLAEDPEA